MARVIFSLHFQLPIQTAFSRTNETSVTMYSNDLMNDLFAATIEATEEAIINALVAAQNDERYQR